MTKRSASPKLRSGLEWLILRSSRRHFGGPKFAAMALEPVFECDDLAYEWDRQDETRQRIRSGGHLVQEFEKKGKSNDATIGECVVNQQILDPCLHRLFGSRKKLPEIEKLREQVELFYLNNQRVVDHSRIDDEAWEIRKMLRFVKRKTSKKDPSLAACPKPSIRSRYFQGSGGSRICIK